MGSYRNGQKVTPSGNGSPPDNVFGILIACPGFQRKQSTAVVEGKEMTFFNATTLSGRGTTAEKVAKINLTDRMIN